MKRPMRRGALARLAGLLVAVLLLAAAPAPREAIAARCGDGDGPICTKNESCVWIIFFKQCTEKYTYYP